MSEKTYRIAILTLTVIGVVIAAFEVPLDL